MSLYNPVAEFHASSLMYEMRQIKIRFDISGDKNEELNDTAQDETEKWYWDKNRSAYKHNEDVDKKSIYGECYTEPDVTADQTKLTFSIIWYWLECLLATNQSYLRCL